MRLRNVKNAKEIIDSSELVITENVFDNNHKLYIEIGCGKGDFIIENALRNPDINYIGIEKYESVLVRALQKVDIIPPNYYFVMGDNRGLSLDSRYNQIGLIKKSDIVGTVSIRIFPFSKIGKIK